MTAGSVGRMPALAILAGGTNSRMRSLRDVVYKAFLPIEGVSLVARHVLRASMFGVDDVVVFTDEDDALAGAGVASLGAVHAGRTTIRHEVVSGTVEEKLLRFAALTAPDADTPVLAVLGDTVAGVDLQALVRVAAGEGVDSAIAVAPFRMPYGRVVLGEGGDRVVRFDEKPLVDSLVNTGYMCLGPAALSSLRESDLAETLQALAHAGRLAAVLSTTEIRSLDTPADVARFVETG